jgi:hypothetical protein
MRRTGSVHRGVKAGEPIYIGPCDRCSKDLYWHTAIKFEKDLICQECFWKLPAKKPSEPSVR